MINYDEDFIVIRPYLPQYQNRTNLNDTRINFVFNLEFHHSNGRTEYMNYNESIKEYIKILAAVRDYDENIDPNLMGSMVYEAEPCKLKHF